MRTENRRIIVIILTCAVSFGFVALAASCGGDEEPTGTALIPTFITPTEMINTTATPSVAVEVSDPRIDPSVHVVGQLTTEFPTWMTPGTSNTIVVIIEIPEKLASVDPLAVSRINIRPDAPQVVGELGTYRTNVYVAESIKIELFSLDFQIKSLYPAARSVDILGFGEQIVWAWTVKAPSTLGAHDIIIRVFTWDDEEPTWTGIVRVAVLESAPTLPATITPTDTPTYTPTPTPSPTPTPTPVPPLARVRDEFIDNSVTIFLALLPIASGAAGIVAKNLLTKKDIEENEKQLNEAQTKIDELSQERQDIAGLKKRIELLEKENDRLRSIRWYEFWRR